MWAALPHDPTAPSAVLFGYILLSALWYAMRAVTICATKRAFKCLRKSVESQVRVHALGFKKNPVNCRGGAGSGAYRFSMQDSRNFLRYRMPALITVQGILGLRVEHLQ